MYDKLVIKLNYIDTHGFVIKTKYNTDKSDLEDVFVSETKYDTDKSDFEKKTSDADKKIPYTSRLVKKQIIRVKSLK